MGKKEEYKRKNEDYLQAIAAEEDTIKLPSGVLYKVIKNGDGNVSPKKDSVVTVHYRGTLINGREFDNSRKGVAPAFRLNQLIKGWQEAIPNMKVGDRWTIYIPASLGYGAKLSGDIPGNSTLVFDIELLGIA